MALCDNLELPFRDESFDAVLSIAVVHHFATTERRVNALRELARILRIGGRVVITVWALEQRHRRFESQDVLIPWQPPKNRNFNYSDEEDDEDFLPPYHAYTEDSTNSSRSAGDGDSSSLSSSSPGESCYSFVRRAIQVSCKFNTYKKVPIISKECFLLPVLFSYKKYFLRLFFSESTLYFRKEFFIHRKYFWTYFAVKYLVLP